MALQFEQEMIAKLSEYKQITEKMSKLDIAKTKIRNQAKQWLALNKTREAYIEDSEGQAWKIDINSVTRKKIENWALLKELAAERKDEIFTEYSSDTFKISKVKGLPIRG